MGAIETSKTHRLYLLLKEQIAAGSWALGERLPSEPQLAAQHNLSRVTVRRALDGLAARWRDPQASRFGFFRNQGGRSAACDRRSVGHAGAPRGNGAILARSVVVVQLCRCAAGCSRGVRLPRDARVQHAVRVRFAGDTPFSYLTTYVPEDIGRCYSRRDLLADCVA